MQVNREKLLHALECCKAGLSPRDVIQQSSSFVFKDGYIVTFNEETATKFKSPLDITGAVPSDPLLGILSKIDDETVEITMAKKQLLIKSRRGRTKITMEEEVLLPLEHLEKPGKWQPLSEEFAKAVKSVQSCASRDDAKYKLTCIHIHPEWIEAFDEFQLARYTFTTGVQTPILVKQLALQNIVPLGMTEFSETDTFLHFRNPQKLILSCRRDAGSTFPSLDHIIKNAKGTPIKLPAGLIEVSEKCEVFSRNNTKEENQVRIDLKPGKCYMTGEGPFGEHTEPRDVPEYKGEPLSFMISPDLLRELVTKYKNTCQVTEKSLRAGDKKGKFVYVTSLNETRDDDEVEEKSTKKKSKTKKKKTKKAA